MCKGTHPIDSSNRATALCCSPTSEAQGLAKAWDETMQVKRKTNKQTYCVLVTEGVCNYVL